MSFRFVTSLVLAVLAMLPFSGVQSGVECKIHLTQMGEDIIRVSVTDATFDAIEIVQTLPSKLTYFVDDSVREIVEDKVADSMPLMRSTEDVLEWESRVRFEMASLATSETPYEYAVSVTQDGNMTGVYSTENAPVWEVEETGGEVTRMLGFDNTTWVIFEQPTQSETVSVFTSGDLGPADFQIEVWDGDTLLNC